LAKHLFSVPPKILTKEDIADLVVREGENLTLSCEASGHPSPHIVWRREDGEDIMVSGKKGNNVFQKLGWNRRKNTLPCWFFLVSLVENFELRLLKISRLHMGDYLCVASNGIPPSTSKKYRLRVQCKYKQNKNTVEFFQYFYAENNTPSPFCGKK
jgi:neurotrimin